MSEKSTTIQVPRSTHKQLKHLATDLGINISGTVPRILIKFAAILDVTPGEIGDVLRARLLTLCKEEDQGKSDLMILSILASRIATKYPETAIYFQRIRDTIEQYGE